MSTELNIRSLIIRDNFNEAENLNQFHQSQSSKYYNRIFYGLLGCHEMDNQCVNLIYTEKFDQINFKDIYDNSMYKYVVYYQTLSINPEYISFEILKSLPTNQCYYKNLITNSKLCLPEFSHQIFNRHETITELLYKVKQLKNYRYTDPDSDVMFRLYNKYQFFRDLKISRTLKTFMKTLSSKILHQYAEEFNFKIKWYYIKSYIIKSLIQFIINRQ
jgi:hypothetical protein